MAAVLTGGIVMLAWIAWRPFKSSSLLANNLKLLLAVLTLQVIAGFAAWVGEFGWNGFVVTKFQMFHVLSTSLHVVLGAMLVVSATALCLKTFHILQPITRTEKEISPAANTRQHSQLETVS